MSEVSTQEKSAQKDWRRAFFTIWTVQALSLLGSNLVQFALIWYLTERTGSATVLAIATLMGMLPQIIVSPIAGAYVDRWNRRYVMMFADGGIALATALLAWLFATQGVAVWHIYGILLLRSFGGAFHWTAMQASTTLMVPESQLARVAGMNQTLQGVANIVVPPMGAVLLNLLPMQAILGLDIGTAIVAIIPLLFIAIPQPPEKPQQDTVVGDIRTGIAYLRRTPGILLLSVQGILIRFLMVPAMALLPLLVIEHFKGDVIHLAGMQAIAGVGVVIGGLVLSIWGGFKRRIVTAMIALIIDGVAILIVGLAPETGILIAIGALFCAGLVEPIMLGSTFAVAQAVIPPDMQGRIFGLLSAFGTAMVPLGLALMGPIADVWGIQFWFIIGGIITMLMGIGAFFIPAIMALENHAIKAT